MGLAPLNGPEHCQSMYGNGNALCEHAYHLEIQKVLLKSDSRCPEGPEEGHIGSGLVGRIAAACERSRIVRCPSHPGPPKIRK
jgi:hypothetical protein